jgi:Trk K+ transport system NAD-binding subunit
MFFIQLFKRKRTLLDFIVVITTDHDYAEELRDAGLIAVHGNPSDDHVLLATGLQRAEALMVMLDSDTETLMTILTARNLAPNLHITAAVIDEELSVKMVRVGANESITPYDTAGQFLNNATLRPAVNNFMFGLFFDMTTPKVVVQIALREGSAWLGQTIRNLRLKERYGAVILGIRMPGGTYRYAIQADQLLEEDQILIVVTDRQHIRSLQTEANSQAISKNTDVLWQQLPQTSKPPVSEQTYSLVEAENAIEDLNNHFIICGSDRIAERAVAKLNPERPFVIISNDTKYTSTLLKRGFRVIHGNPIHETTLIKAGIKRAQAMMVAIESKADSILTILTARALNKRLLITTTAYSDDMISKLEQAGADRVLSPFHVAARFILLKTTMPEVSAFMDTILFNYQTQLETTELYMEDDSPWIGKDLRALNLGVRFQAGVIGIRLADHSFIYAPSKDHVLQVHQVLIVITPMKHSDTLRAIAHG